MASVKRVGTTTQFSEKAVKPNFVAHPGYRDNGAPKGKGGSGGKMSGKPMSGKSSKMC